MDGPVLATFADPETVQACDEVGNPVCPGCLENQLGAVVRHNSGDRRKCLCPPRRRDLFEPTDLATARALLHRVADILDRTGHADTCTCPACEALGQLHGPGIDQHIDALDEHRHREQLVAPVEAALRGEAS